MCQCCCTAIYVLLQKKFVYGAPEGDQRKLRWKDKPISLTAWAYFSGAFSVALQSCLHTHAHTYNTTLHYTCYHDEIKGIQELKICSHCNSQILSDNSLFTSSQVGNCVGLCLLLSTHALFVFVWHCCLLALIVALGGCCSSSSTLCHAADL